MKSMLTAFAAISALALPAGLPTLVAAQEVAAEQTPSNDVGGRYQADESSAQPIQAAYQQPPQRQPSQNRRGEGRGDRGDRGGDVGGGDRSERGGSDNRGGRDRSIGAGQGGDGRWNRSNPTAPPVVTPQTQDRSGPGRDRGGSRDGSAGGWTGDQDRDRGGRDGNRGDRDRPNGGWNGETPGRGTPGRGIPGRAGPGGDTQGRDRNGQDWNRGNDRDRNSAGWNRGGDRNNGGWNNGQNGRNWNSDRNGRRDYGGFQNRWNQNDWRRDWNRGRNSDWWRNDRGFRGYTGVRLGFYFAPNYGYYSVPRNYWGQTWYEGQYLPSVFWRYSLSDYRTYGLGFPPPGTQWVAVDNTIYLIDSFDGYIVEVIRDAWRW